MVANALAWCSLRNAPLISSWSVAGRSGRSASFLVGTRVPVRNRKISVSPQPLGGGVRDKAHRRCGPVWRRHRGALRSPEPPSFGRRHIPSIRRGGVTAERWIKHNARTVGPNTPGWSPGAGMPPAATHRHDGRHARPRARHLDCHWGKVEHLAFSLPDTATPMRSPAQPAHADGR
jgi:hypothetical protein